MAATVEHPEEIKLLAQALAKKKGKRSQASTLRTG